MEETTRAMRERLNQLTRELEECHDFESIEQVTEQMAEIANWLQENGEGMTDDETSNPIVEPLGSIEAQRMVQRYCCSACWSHLLTFNRPGKGLYVLCPDCGDKTPGYVSKSWVERRKAESLAEAYSAKQNLKDALPFLNKTAKQSAESILAEIGF